MSAVYGEVERARQGRADFDRAIEQLQAETANVGAHLAWDASVRQAYARAIAQMSRDLQMQVQLGQLTWKQAAEQANQTRNVILELLRGRSTPVGRAMAELLKKKGLTLNELIARKTMQLHGERAVFAQLSAAQKDAVYAAIVESSGRSNARVTSVMRSLSYGGRALVVMSLSISVYNIATADDKVEAVKREGAVTAAGVAGGVAGSALAELACGPGAPVCVTIGAFVGGACAAMGVSLFW